MNYSAATSPVGEHAGTVCRLYKVWTSLAEPKPRAALDPLEIGPQLLPHVALLHVLPDDFRFDLVGGSVARFAKNLRPGSPVGELVKQRSDLSAIHALLERVATTGLPLAFVARQFSFDHHPRACFVMLLPLGIGKGARAEDLLLGLWPLPRPPAIASEQRIDLFEDLDRLAVQLAADARPRRSLGDGTGGAESLACLD